MSNVVKCANPVCDRLLATDGHDSPLCSDCQESMVRCDSCGRRVLEPVLVDDGTPEPIRLCDDCAAMIERDDWRVISVLQPITVRVAVPHVPEWEGRDA